MTPGSGQAVTQGLLLLVDLCTLCTLRAQPISSRHCCLQVSKEVQKTRDYEAALLRSYQAFLKQLLETAQCVQKRTGTVQHARVAVRCMCKLLTSLPHFNYT